MRFLRVLWRRQRLEVSNRFQAKLKGLLTLGDFTMMPNYGKSAANSGNGKKSRTCRRVK
jgi:hypothetical protein